MADNVQIVALKRLAQCSLGLAHCRPVVRLQGH
jgi:hypothetical protein